MQVTGEIRVKAILLELELAFSGTSTRLQNFSFASPNDFRLEFLYPDFGAVKNMVCALISSSMLSRKCMPEEMNCV